MVRTAPPFLPSRPTCLLAIALALASSSALAATYQYRVYLPGFVTSGTQTPVTPAGTPDPVAPEEPTPPAPPAPDPLTVVLQAAALPQGTVGQAYSFDFKSLLQITGDSSIDMSLATFSTTATLPAGLSLTADGILSGLPSAQTAGLSLPVSALYKAQPGQQTYTLVINGVVFQVTQLVGGANHSCALTVGGGVKCWGSGIVGQLGNGTTTDQLSPVDVQGLPSGVVSLSAGYNHTCAVTSAGAALCWGSNVYGQLGDNTKTASPTPVAVQGLSSGVTAIAAGYGHTCAVVNGGAKCWGYNTYGQLGVNSTTDKLVPTDVSGLTSGVASLGNGDYYSCAVTAGGGAKCWGLNDFGQLGNNGTSNKLVPTDVSGLTSGVAQIAGAHAHTCAVTTGGGAKCWGYNGYGQLGNNSTTDRQSPVDAQGLTSGVSQITAGLDHTCAVVSGGAKCWGRNVSGELGDGTVARKQVPTTVQGLASGVSQIGAGWSHTCAALSTGTAQCWGSNAKGQLGDKSTTNRTTPVTVTP